MFNRTTTKVNLLVFIAIFILYMFLGAQLFSTIERPSEELIIQQMIQTRKSFLEKYPCVQGASDEQWRREKNEPFASSRTGFRVVHRRSARSE